MCRHWIFRASFHPNVTRGAYTAKGHARVSTGRVTPCANGFGKCYSHTLKNNLYAQLCILERAKRAFTTSSCLIWFLAFLTQLLAPTYHPCLGQVGQLPPCSPCKWRPQNIIEKSWQKSAVKRPKFIILPLPSVFCNYWHCIRACPVWV